MVVAAMVWFVVSKQGGNVSCVCHRNLKPSQFPVLNHPPNQSQLALHVAGRARLEPGTSVARASLARELLGRLLNDSCVNVKSEVVQ